MTITTEALTTIELDAANAPIPTLTRHIEAVRNGMKDAPAEVAEHARALLLKLEHLLQQQQAEPATAEASQDFLAPWLTPAVELGPKGVRVVNVAPGAVDTPINAATMHDDDSRRRLTDSIPLGSVASPEQIASVVAFVASDGASYMTGTTVVVDGAMMQAGVGL